MHILGETPSHSDTGCLKIESIIPSNHESTTTTRLQEHNDKYIYKSVASLVQYISKDILSLQWPLSNEKGRLFQLVILIIRINVIIMVKHSSKNQKLDINAVLKKLEPPAHQSHLIRVICSLISGPHRAQQQ